MNIKKYDDDFSSDDSYCFLDHNNADDIGATGSYLISKGDQIVNQKRAQKSEAWSISQVDFEGATRRRRSSNSELQRHRRPDLLR